VNQAAAAKFKEFFETHNIPRYGQRSDLSRLNPVLREQLRLFQETFNFALENEQLDVAGHVDHPPFHVDYVDAEVANANAFRYGEYSFIAISVPLIYELSDLCLVLSRSPLIAQLLAVQYSGENYNQLHAVMFAIITAFVVAHEYTHHVFGHTSESDALNVFLGMASPSIITGSQWVQVDELVADGYAIYHVLANYVGKLNVNSPNQFFALNADKSCLTDEQMFATIVVTVAGLWLTWPEQKPDLVKIYGLDHPLVPARLKALMHESIGWCRQNRHELEEFMVGNFQALLSGAAQAVLGEKSNQVWAEQTAFLKSPDGTRYVSALMNGVDRFRDVLKSRG
jgi:hypothetical protein